MQVVLLKQYIYNICNFYSWFSGYTSLSIYSTGLEAEMFQIQILVVSVTPVYDSLVESHCAVLCMVK